jgi:hypothetical protein
MKISNFKLRLVLLAISLLFPFFLPGQIIKNFSFDATKVERKITNRNGKNFEIVQLKNVLHASDVGKPDLPACFYTFYIPKGKTVTSVTFKTLKLEEIQITHDLFPVQHPVPINYAEKDTSFDVPDSKVYNSDINFPEKQAIVYHTDYFDGDLQLVTVEVYPMQYQPKQKKLMFSNSFSISLNITSLLTSKTLSSVISKTHDKASLELIKTLVVNPEDITLAAENTITSRLKSAAVSNWSIPFYEYVIVTSRSLKPAFTEFASWKKQKGYNTGIVCIEDILSDSYATGDAVSNLNDDAGKLRQYLKSGFDANITKYALLGGDYNIIPIRYGCGQNNYGDVSAEIPSDLYFSDFNGNWNYDGDIYLGEPTEDRVDFGPEIFVGRLLCNNENDIRNWTRKLKIYEQNPGGGDYTYLSKFVASQADQLQDRKEAENVSAYLPAIFTSKTIMNETLNGLPASSAPWPTYPKGSEVINKINEGCGLCSSFNHGGPKNYGTITYGTWGSTAYPTPPVNYDVKADESFTYNDFYDPGSGFNALTNYIYPAIFYSITCETMPFDDYLTSNGTRNLAEAFTCMFKGGGPAYLGNTRNGYILVQCAISKIFISFIK